MSHPSTQHANPMEGGGAYGRHSRITAAGGSLAIPLLEEAAERITLDDADRRPIVIADYGSADGRNSLAPMNVAIAALRKRVGARRAIVVCHTDLPGNDYSTLFRMMDGDVDSYARRDPMTFHTR